MLRAHLTHALRVTGILLVGAGLLTELRAQSGIATPSAYKTIKEAEIKADMFVLAGDPLRGREAGTLDEMQASMWIGEQFRKIGLLPMGDGGTWFQWFNMRRTRISTVSSSVRVGGAPLAFWTDVTPTSNTAADVVGKTVFVGDGRDTTINVQGRVAVVTLVPTSAGTRSTVNTPEYRAVRQGISVQGGALARRGAAAVIVVADDLGEQLFDGVAKLQSRGGYTVPGGASRFANAPGQTGRGGRAGGAGDAGGRGGGGRGGQGGAAPVPVILVRRASMSTLQNDGQDVEIHIRSESFDSPSMNIIGAVRGTDPQLRDEYVVFSSHQDHDGVRFNVNGDSIWNGADDNASTSVALLAIARAWVKQPSKRSALFIFHGAEERGLLGSLWHAAHPVVPLEKMAALLNGDMIGRNHPDTASILGVQPPHRNSTALVQMALEANQRTAKFVLDSIWDRPTHPEGWYFRSDHLPYARLRVPALMYSTNLHSDYHTPMDNPDRIDFAKLTRMTQWMYLTGWLVGNSRERPGIDPDFQLER
jgi:peptidase M28-like protein